MAETLTELVDASGQLQREACIEQCGVLVSLYWGDLVALKTLLNICGGGQVLFFNHAPTEQVPCFCMARQGTHYYFWVAGTVIAEQWVGNFLGAVAPEPYGPDRVVHGYFWGLFNAILDTTANWFPPAGPDVRVTFVGHSLGGAIAHLMGWAYFERYGRENVEIFTLGQPKTLTLPAVNPDDYPRYIRLWVPGDPVPLVPVGAELAFGFLLSGGFALRSIIYSWVHYGRGWVLQTDGTLSEEQAPAWYEQLPGYSLFGLTPANHYIRAISGFLAKQ